MYFKTNICIFKTPLDSSYKNVYDDYTSSADYLNFLKYNFAYEEIPLPISGSSRKNVGDLFSFVVDGYDSIDLHDYNYISFTTTNDETKFAFILSVESVNDDQAEYTAGKRSTCKLNCKLDAWANHYLSIKYSYSNVNENQCTYDDFLLKNYNVGMRKAYSKTSLIRATLLDNSKDTANETIYVPFWQVVKYGAMQQMEATIDDVTRVGLATPADSIEDMATVYNLAFVAEIPQDGNTGIKLSSLSKNITINITPTQWGTPQLRTYTFTVEDTVNYLPFKSDQILHHFVTPNVPFSYTLSKSGNTLSIVIDEYASIADTIRPFVGGEESLDIVENYAFSIRSSYKSETTLFTPYLNSTKYTSAIRYSDFLPEYSPLYYEFPFNYKSVRYNDNEIVVLGIENSDLPLQMRYEQNRAAFPSIHYIGFSDSVSCYLNGKQENLPIAGVPAEKYIARNQASIFANALTPVLSANIAPAIKEITNLIDLRNYPNKYNTVQFPCQALLQSSIPLVVDNRDANINQHIIDIHKNGAIVNMQMNAFSVRKDCFDIDKGEIESNFIADEDTKMQIINAYKNGICRWHIGSSHSSERLNILASMNKNCANFNVSEIS